MTNILESIIEKKKIEVADRKKNTEVTELEKAVFFKRETLILKDFLLKEDKTGIVAEFKRKSPSRGVINDKSSVTEVTEAYSNNGASAISVLTDENFFGGSLSDLQEARINKIPLLRKDFIIDEYQLIESKAYGADVILLIAACLTKDEVQHLSAFANNIGLNVLLEIHNEQELEHLCDNIDVVGVNNRDLKTFTVDINRSIELSKQIPAEKVKISESGIDTIEAIQVLKENGFNGFLMGEKFMKEINPGLAFQDFTQKLKMQK